MKLSILQNESSFSGDLIAYLLTEEQSKELHKLPFDIPAIARNDFKGKAQKTVHVNSGKTRVLLVGLGKEISAEGIRRSSSVVAAFAKSRELQSVGIVVPQNYLEQAVEGAFLTTYNFDRYKSEKKKRIASLSFITAEENANAVLRRTELVCNNVFFVRDLVNLNADYIHTNRMVDIAKKVAKESRMKCTVLDQKKLKKLGLNLISAVGKGSQYPPYLVILEYNGSSRSEKTALVGKGITFDTGGLNLKPTGYMEDMRCDMAGSATVLGIMKTAAELKVRRNIIGVLALAENAISGNCYKPGDVYRAYNGVSVEIGNTDAEGRLVLADALSYTVKNYKPSLIIDFATLTGACLVALGFEAAGMFGTSTEKQKLKELGEKLHERVWELPIYDEYDEDIESDIADIKNIGNKSYAGAVMGAMFLKKFVGQTPWIHFDIAGVAWYNDRSRFYKPKYATGNMVRLLSRYLED